jgi:hypothetical protein
MKSVPPPLSVQALLGMDAIVFQDASGVDQLLWFLAGHTLRFIGTGAPQALDGFQHARPPQASWPPGGSNPPNYFKWAAELQSALPGRVLDPAVLAATDPPGVAATIELDFGSFGCSNLDQVNNQFVYFSFEPLDVVPPHPVLYGPLPNVITVALGNFTSAVVQRTLLSGVSDPDRRMTAINLPLVNLAADVTITLWNSPLDHILGSPMPSAYPFVTHFELFSGLCNPAVPVRVPYAAELSGPGPTAHNISCPPLYAEVTP